MTTGAAFPRQNRRIQIIGLIIAAGLLVGGITYIFSPYKQTSDFLHSIDYKSISQVDTEMLNTPLKQFEEMFLSTEGTDTSTVVWKEDSSERQKGIYVELMDRVNKEGGECKDFETGFNQDAQICEGIDGITVKMMLSSDGCYLEIIQHINAWGFSTEQSFN